MNYDEGVKFMKDLYANEKDGMFYVDNECEILIEFPTFKRGEDGGKIIGDYLLKIIKGVPNRPLVGNNLFIRDFLVREQPPHLYICDILFRASPGKGRAYIKFLEDVYENGTNIDYSDHPKIYDDSINITPKKKLTAENLALLIYWITVQEEINYPQKKGKWGRRLSFCRYYEAVRAAYYKDSLAKETFKKVQNRCDKDVPPELWPPLKNEQQPSFYQKPEGL
ncbi:hypothetical protein SAMN02910456_02523 [Ruminococcaceae bacterium YRB3002]|nr:hypothetical protein SAMN02910456_02523 [Ruminococcaceae bacterium YRB3002]